jgi:hypothetical protein
MTHPDEGTLQALLDGELRPDERAGVERHVAGCPPCAAELESLRGAAALFAGAILKDDVPVDVDQALWRFEGRRRRPAVARRFAGGAMGRAAVLLLASAAVLSATVPGSPIRAWLTSLGEGPVATETRAPDADAAPSVLSTEHLDDAPAGVSVLPLEGRMRVVFLDPAEGVRLRVRLHDGDRVGVWATGAAVGAHFRTAPDRVEVQGVRDGEVRVEIPRGGREFTLEVDGRVYLRTDGERLIFPGPAADTTGPEILFEVGS